MSAKLHWFILVIILLIGVGWRLPLFAPASLNWDEVSLGYNAYSILKTGRDEWGIAMPTIFRAFGDYKLPVYVYMTTLWPQYPRVTSVVAGSLSMLIAYLLARKLFNKNVGLVTLLLVALSPWTVMLSRLALEASLAILFISLGMVCLVSRKYFWAFVFLGLSVWTYNSARVFVPIFLFLYLIASKTYKKLSAINYLLLTIILVPMFLQLFNQVGQARYKTLSLIDEGAIGKINELQTTLPGGRLVYNKATYWLGSFTKNYISYLSPNFLFIKGGDHYQFSVQNFGLLYLICFPFFYFGILNLFGSSNLKFRILILTWLFLAPVAGSITRDSPHTLRAVVMLPLSMMLTALGIVSILKRYYLLIFPVIIFSSINYQLLTLNYYQNYSWAWQYGYQQAVNYVKQHYSQYDQIIFTKKYGEPHEFFAFYWPWEPTNFAKAKAWDYHANWYWVNQLDKIQFVNDWEMKTQVFKPKTLIISSPENDTDYTELTRINFQNGQPAFIIRKL